MAINLTVAQPLHKHFRIVGVFVYRQEKHASDQ